MSEPALKSMLLKGPILSKGMLTLIRLSVLPRSVTSVTLSVTKFVAECQVVKSPGDRLTDKSTKTLCSIIPYPHGFETFWLNENNADANVKQCR